MKKLSNREIVEILYHNALFLDPRVTEIGLDNGDILKIINGELYKQ
jgi:hypothetical protein